MIDLKNITYDFPESEKHLRTFIPENTQNTNLTNKSNFIDFITKNHGIFCHIFTYSPFLYDSVMADCDFWDNQTDKTAESILSTIMNDAIALTSPENQSNLSNQTYIMQHLRLCKRRISSLCGIMDIAGIWDLQKVTHTLSQFANTCCQVALSHSLYTLYETGVISELPDLDTSGFVILAMGKMGAQELNYSSDIDIIAFYDETKISIPDKDRFKERVVRVFKTFIQILEQKTAVGYVFRVDFRLRPNPSTTPVILSKNAMLQYYETMGVTWERYAMIKCTPVAGDIQLGKAFLHDIHSFIWRKSLDFTALDDIYTIKNKINHHRSNFELQCLGHNIKLGVGGIREIEFYVQSHQMIWGGRVPSLRCKGTLEVLQVLLQENLCDSKTVDTLSNAYTFHRMVEHRLQMVADKQTHTIPKDTQSAEAIAHFCGFSSLAKFSKKTVAELHAVSELYSKLFEDNNVSTAPHTAQNTPQTSHFSNTGKKDAILKKWLSGAYKSTRNEKSQALLLDIKGDIISAIEHTTNPDECLLSFDTFLERLPSGVQFFWLLKSNPNLLRILISIMDIAPRLSNDLVKTPSLLDCLVRESYTEDAPENDVLTDLLHTHCNDAKDFQDILDCVRQFKQELYFEQGVRVLENLEKPHNVCDGLSRIARTSLEFLIPNAHRNYKYSCGDIATGRYAVLAFGKLGGNEMTQRSDVDLVFVYDSPDTKAVSDGKRAIGATQYYNGLAQRIITAISSQTQSGTVFETDMRLRPHGQSGALACGYDSFKNYYTTDQAWTWEHMALTKASVLYSNSPAFADTLQTCISDILQSPRDCKKTKSDIIEMRHRLINEFYDNNPFYIKHRPGGMIDIEFIAQGLQILNAHTHKDTDTHKDTHKDTQKDTLHTPILHTHTMTALGALHKNGIICNADFKVLQKTFLLWQDIQGIIRLTTKNRFTLDTATAGQLQSLLQCANSPTIESLENHINDTAQQIHAIFNRYFNT